MKDKPWYEDWMEKYRWILYKNHLLYHENSELIIYYTNNYDDLFQYQKEGKTFVITKARKIIYLNELEAIIHKYIPDYIDEWNNNNFPSLYTIKNHANELLVYDDNKGKEVTPEIAKNMKNQIKRKHKQDKETLINRRGHQCENCKKTDWFGMPIPLELHHINKNPYDNQESNLQLLCIQCHKLIHYIERKDLEHE